MGCEPSRDFAICLRACDSIRERKRKFGVTNSPLPSRLSMSHKARSCTVKDPPRGKPSGKTPFAGRLRITSISFPALIKCA